MHGRSNDIGINARHKQIYASRRSPQSGQKRLLYHHLPEEEDNKPHDKITHTVMPCQNASNSTEIKPRKGNYLKNKGLCKCPDFKIPFLYHFAKIPLLPYYG